MGNILSVIKEWLKNNYFCHGAIQKFPKFAEESRLKVWEIVRVVEVYIAGIHGRDKA